MRPQAGEAAVVRLVEAQLDRRDRWYVNNYGGARSEGGVPDILTCDSSGRLLAIECKRRGEQPYPNQWRHAMRILASGGRYVVAYQDFDLDEVDRGAVRSLEVGTDYVGLADSTRLDDATSTVECVAAGAL